MRRKAKRGQPKVVLMCGVTTEAGASSTPTSSTHKAGCWQPSRREWNSQLVVRSPLSVYPIAKARLFPRREWLSPWSKGSKSPEEGEYRTIAETASMFFYICDAQVFVETPSSLGIISIINGRRAKLLDKKDVWLVAMPSYAVLPLPTTSVHNFARPRLSRLNRD